MSIAGWILGCVHNGAELGEQVAVMKAQKDTGTSKLIFVMSINRMHFVHCGKEGSDIGSTMGLTLNDCPV